MEDPIHQPHDKLFKASFSDPANAAGLLIWQLPPALASVIDWDSLALEPGSFVDSHYRASESDLLFSARIGSARCFLYVLFEHVSEFDPFLTLKLLRYMVRIWEAFLSSSKRPDKDHAWLPAILPVVVAQNGETWNLATRFSDLFDVPEEVGTDLECFIPNFLVTTQPKNVGFAKITTCTMEIIGLDVLRAS